jgi:integrase
MQPPLPMPPLPTTSPAPPVSDGSGSSDGEAKLRQAWEEVKQWSDQHANANTKRTYSTYRSQFHEWCAQKGLSPLPANPITVARFMQYCATAERELGSGRPLSKGTVTRAVPSAIADDHKRAGLTSPTESPIVAAAKQTAARAAPQGRGSKEPLTPELLRRMLAAPLQPNESKFMRARNEAMVLLMTAAFLRESELVALQMDDIVFEQWPTPSATQGGGGGGGGSGEGRGGGGGGGASGQTIDVLLVKVARSKTDQEAQGVTVFVADGEGDTPLKPIESYARWMNLRWDEGGELFDENPIVPHSDFAFPNLKTGAPLSSDTPRTIIKRWLKAIGVDPEKYGGHSARSGGATSAAHNGIAIDLLRRHGRWRSDAVFVYIHDSPATRIATSRAALADN